MAHIVEDNVRESTTTTGTGNISLGGALNTGRTFSSVAANSDTVHYAIHHTTLNEWEVGLGTYQTSGNVLVRTTPLESSNSGAAVNFSAGTKNVELVLPGQLARVIYGLQTLTGVASTTEVLTGTAADKAVTPDALAALWEAGTDNAGGATITMGEGGFFNLITSTTAITAFSFTNDKAGRTAHIRFNTARVLTHNSTSLILPIGGANITTEVGDTCVLMSLGSGNFRVISYQRADGRTILGPTDPMVFDFADDFHGNVVTSPIYPWTETNSAAGTNTRQVVADHPGVIRIVTGAVSGNNKRVHLDPALTSGIITPSSAQRFSWIVRIPTITTLTIRLGLMQDISAANGGTAGAYFQFDPAVNANWQFVTRQASTSTPNSGSPSIAVVANNWYVLEARRLGTGNWEFLVNGVSRFTSSSNNPTTACNFGALCQTNTAAARNLDLDFGAIRSLAQRFT